MKKVLPKILIPLNLAIIVLLLLVSGAMLFFSSSSGRDIFGYCVFLFEDKSISTSQQPVLLIVENNAENVKIGDKTSYYVRDVYNNKTQFVDTIASITDNVATFDHSSNKVNITSDLFVGRVVSETAFWGTVFSAIVNSKHTLLIYVCLISGFLIISLIIILGMVILEKKKNNILLDQESEIEVTIENDEIDTNEDEIQSEDLQSVYDDEIIQSAKSKLIDPLVRVEHKDGVVLPNGLSQPRLTSDKPLFDSRTKHIDPPKNIGSTRKLKTFSERDENDNNAIETESDLFNLYQVIEQTNELNIHYTEVAEEVHVDVNDVDIMLSYSEIETNSPPQQVKSDNLESTSPPIDFNFTIDSMLDDIIRKVEEEFNQNNK